VLHLVNTTEYGYQIASNNLDHPAESSANGSDHRQKSWDELKAFWTLEQGWVRVLRGAKQSLFEVRLSMCQPLSTTGPRHNTSEPLQSGRDWRSEHTFAKLHGASGPHAMRGKRFEAQQESWNCLQTAIPSTKTPRKYSWRVRDVMNVSHVCFTVSMFVILSK
jgi:hypothetical protein